MQDGRTWAAGTRGGVGYLRVYEAGKHPDRVHLRRPNWARAELEARPHYARDKLAAASMSPLDVWGLCRWTHQVGQRLSGCEINRFEPQARQYSHDKTTLYIARTFRRHLEEMSRNGEDLMRTCRDIWDADDLASQSKTCPAKRARRCAHNATSAPIYPRPRPRHEAMPHRASKRLKTIHAGCSVSTPYAAPARHENMVFALWNTRC